jgi:NAD(P)H-hydrate epimerase
MRGIDEVTIRDHVPGITLMENAGKGVTEELLAALKPGKKKPVVVVCGKGNNGGDGFVIARLLKAGGYRVRAYLLGKGNELKGDAAANYRRCKTKRITVREVSDDLSGLERDLAGAEVIVDAIFGTGFSGRPRGAAGRVIDLINAAPGAKVAVDMPSGVDSSTGEAEQAAEATITVTMALPKRGHLLYPGKSFTGELVVVDIGVPPEVVFDSEPATFLVDSDDVRQALPARAPTAHKWTCGHVAVIAGSRGYTGAAALTSRSAMRSGAGLVTLAIPAGLHQVMEIKLTEVMTRPMAETAEQTLSSRAAGDLRELTEKADAVALGPGLSINPDTSRLVRSLVPDLGRPVVLDADGVNAFTGKAKALKGLDFPLVVTPHPGEASRLTGVPTGDILSDPVEFARRTAGRLGLVLVLKGAPTVVAGPGGKAFVNPTGNPGLATAGSGDVLTGLVSGLLAQGVGALEAACSGVFLHGLAGDLLLAEKRYYGYLAGDMVDRIPQAMAAVATA